MTQDPAPQAAPTRLTFDQQFFGASAAFAEAIIGEVPELLTVSIVPAWKTPQEHLPYAIVRNGDGQLPNTATQIVRTIEAHLNVANSQFQNMEELLKSYDQEMSRMAEEIRARQTKLQEAYEESQRPQADAGADEAGQDGTGEPDPGPDPTGHHG